MYEFNRLNANFFAFIGKFTPEYFTKMAKEFSDQLVVDEQIEHPYLANFDEMWQKIEAGGGIGTNYVLVDFIRYVPGISFTDFLQTEKYIGTTVDKNRVTSRVNTHRKIARGNKDRSDLVSFL